MTDLSKFFPLSAPSMTEGLEETHQIAQLTPLGDPSLEYNITLPKGWVIESNLGEQQGGIGQLVRIGLFADHAGPDAAVVQVSYAKVPVEVNLMDWLQYQSHITGMKLVHRQLCEFSHGIGIDAGGLTGTTESPFVARLKCFADSGRIFLVVGMAPQTKYESVLRDLTVATQSFHLAQGTGVPQLEQLFVASVQAPAFQVAYPASWSPEVVEENIAGKSGIDLRLLVDDELMAYVRVKAIAPEQSGDVKPESLVSDATTELAETGIALSGPWQDDPDDTLKNVEQLEFALLAIGTIADSKAELRVAGIQRGGQWFVVTLLSVPREQNPVLWMRSKRGYEIALRSVNPETSGDSES